MKTMQYIFTCCSLSVLLFSCDSFLDENPKGVLSNEQLNTPENVEKMVIAAYSSLGRLSQSSGFRYEKSESDR